MKLNSIYVTFLFLTQSFNESFQLKIKQKPKYRAAEKCLTPTCINKKRDLHITTEERHLLTFSHNKIRNQMALGLYNQLIATDMKKLSWNDELASMASQDSSAQTTSDDQYVGQNIALLDFKHLSRGATVGLQVALNMWFNERSRMHLGFDEINEYSPYIGRTARNFTQVIWAKTQHIGCGRVFADGNGSWYLICNYLPKGNIAGEKIYSVGKKSRLLCPEVSPNYLSNWKGLCASEYDDTDDILFRGIQVNRSSRIFSIWCYILYVQNILLLLVLK